MLAQSSDQTISVLELYRVKCLVSTTSDWTSVFSVGGAQIGGARLEILEGEDAPELTYYSDVAAGLILSVGKKQYDKSRVKIEATLTYTELEAVDRLTIRIEKGDVGETIVSIYNFNGEEPSLAKTFANRVRGRHPNPAQFSVTAKDLTIGGPLLARSREFNRLVWAFYYPWYESSSWYSPIISDKPLIGNYESSDLNTIRKHMRIAKSAGIDGFIVSWCTDWCPSENLDTILEAANAENFKVSIYLESLAAEGWSGVPRTEASLESMLTYFFQRYGNDGRYYRLDDRPVLFVFAVGSQPVGTWSRIFANLNAIGYRGFYIADTSDVAYLRLFDGIHLYGPLGAFADLARGYKALSLGVRSSGLLYPQLSADKLWAPTIMPGYDETRIPGRPGAYFPREGGEVYQQTFGAAMESNPDWIIITSFNEWWENTHVEPSETYGWKYIDLTTVYSSEFKGVKFLPSLQTSRRASVEGQDGRLDIVITNNGNGSAIDLIAKDYTPPEIESSKSVDRLLPGEEIQYSVSFSIPLGQVSLQLPAGQVTSSDVYGYAHSVQTSPLLQHYLTVMSPYGLTSGSGWYEAGSIASFAVSATLLPERGIMGMLGVKNIFDRWGGDSTAASPNATIVMDSPKTVTAVWSKDYTQFYAIAGISIAAIVLMVALAIYRRGRARKGSRSRAT